ncbi:MAG TPA: DUF4253 domain-containing protein [Tepidisphaeraceae bacterium]
MNNTPQDIALARDLGFNESVITVIKAHTDEPIDRLMTMNENGEHEPTAGLSVRVADGEEAERLLNAMRDPLAKLGYRAFWSERIEANGLKESDEIAVLKTSDPYAMIRLRKSDGANYGLFTEDILDRLDAWRKLGDFEVVGASGSWVAIQFARLPENICTFAEEVYLFCPDSVTQGVGLSQAGDVEKVEAARALCPGGLSESVRQKLSSELGQIASMVPTEASDFSELLHAEVETGIRLLAAELRRSNYLFLWWD